MIKQQICACECTNRSKIKKNKKKKTRERKSREREILTGKEMESVLLTTVASQ